MNRRYAHWLTLAAYFGLMAFLCAWLIRLDPPTQFSVGVGLLVLVMPLTIPMRGLLHGRPKAHFWAAMLCLLYLFHGLVTVIDAAPARLLGAVEILLSLTVIVAGSLYARWTGGVLPPKPPAE